MTIEEFNRTVAAAYEAAFRSEARLAAAYQAAFEDAAGVAARRFEAETLTAAWTPPPTETLYDDLPDAAASEAEQARLEAVEAALAVLAVLGVTTMSAGVLLAVAERGQANFDAMLSKTIREVVESSLDAGLTAEETAAALRSRLIGLAPSTSLMIAQTEITTLVNERALAAANKTFRDATEPVYKTWVTMRDNRVRPAHASTDGQTVPLSQPFTVGGALMMYPGDPSAPLSLVLRCRCRMTYTETLIASAQEATLMTVTETSDLTAAVTITVDDAPDAADAAPVAWRALLAVEGEPTEDGRMIEPGALTWRELPLSLMALTETGPGGHEGAQLAGRIDTIWREGNEIWGSGEFDTGPVGADTARLVGERTLRGNSVDLAILSYEYRNAETGEVVEGEAIFDAYFEDTPLLFVVTEGSIMASTVCPTPAIAQAEIMLASAGALVMRFSFLSTVEIADRPANLTAAAAGLAPLHPPLDWFNSPGLAEPTALTVTPEGRVFGHAALWDSCHIGEPSGPGICVPPPRSGMNYTVFHHGACTTAEGVDVPVGQITLGTLHASRDLSWANTIRHYEDSGLAVADVCAGEDEHGIWVSGALRPDVPAAKVREMKAGALSGDWRQVIGRGLEFLAALVVNVPGFPIPRPEARVVASASGEEIVLALVAAGIVQPDELLEETEEPEMSWREYLRQRNALTT